MRIAIFILIGFVFFCMLDLRPILHIFKIFAEPRHFLHFSHDRSGCQHCPALKYFKDFEYVLNKCKIPLTPRERPSIYVVLVLVWVSAGEIFNQDSEMI